MISPRAFVDQRRERAQIEYVKVACSGPVSQRHCSACGPTSDGAKYNGTRSATRAVATVVVTRSEAKSYDEGSNPALFEIALTETFTGDIEAESEVRALQARRDDRSARMVSLQRIRGTLGGRRGSFVLQGSETIESGRIKATWFVVPGSGSGDLSGLRGEGGFEGEFGKSSDAILDYWFA